MYSKQLLVKDIDDQNENQNEMIKEYNLIDLPEKVKGASTLVKVNEILIKHGCDKIKTNMVLGSLG